MRGKTSIAAKWTLIGHIQKKKTRNENKISVQLAAIRQISIERCQMAQELEFSIKSSYSEFLEGLRNALPIRNPAGLISAVIWRSFRWALQNGLTFEELFQEGVITLWTAARDRELPDNPDAGGSFYSIRVRWFLLGYCRALFKEQAIPMSQIVSDLEDDEERWLTDVLLQDPRQERPGSLSDLIEEIMRVVKEKGLQGKENSGWKLRGDTEQKIRQILHYLAAGYNGLEIAVKLGYASESSVNHPIAALARKLRQDESFRDLYGEFIPEERPGRRPGGQFRGSTRANKEELESAKESFRELVPEDVLEAASKKAAGEKLNKHEQARLDQFREQWGWLLDK
ncbi:MAG: hypothetical protein ABIG08_01235 [bacterium]